MWVVWQASHYRVDRCAGREPRASDTVGGVTLSSVVTLRPEVWSTVTAPPDTSAAASRPRPGVALMRTGQSLASSVGAGRRR